MRARRFQGPTVSAAYEHVRAALGDDAVIISTRNATAPGMLGFGAREFVEVVAGIPEEAELDRSVPLRPLAQDAAAHDLVRGIAEQAAARAEGEPEVELAPPFLNSMAGSAHGGPFDAITRVSAARGVQPPVPASAAPAALDRALLANLAAGLQEVRALLERLTREHVTSPVEAGPAPLAELRDRLLAQGVRHALLLSLLDEVARSVTPDASGEAVRQAAESALAAQLPPPITLDLARRPHAIFIVGPSGAGKTTAAVRLGMQFTQQGLHVTVAGTDVDRAGAPQQLQAFGAAAGLRVRTCYTPGELQALIADGESDVVIVDTVGHNGARTDRMAELGAFMQVARERTVLLALPATMQSEDLLRLTRAFTGLHPGGLLLTRCDETETFGGLWSAVEQAGIGIAYTTHDDAVGEPAHPGDNHALATAVQLGRWPARVSTASGFGRRAG
jgi:flagellar biosynthesis protein FlhF